MSPIPLCVEDFESLARAKVRADQSIEIGALTTIPPGLLSPQSGAGMIRLAST